jgi:hypothetical protein
MILQVLQFRLFLFLHHRLHFLLSMDLHQHQLGG